MKLHEKYMLRCIELAKNGLGTTYPNPLVGSVLVVDSKIIGEGWHQKAGGPHAEVNAIASVRDEQLLRKATIYVNLEPCSHVGRTPPCANLIIDKGIRKVVIGTTDPHHKVAGKGIQRLRAAGCEVTVGVLENQCLDLNKRFFTFHQKQRPFIILKWAQTADGLIAPEERNEQAPVWITNSYSKQRVHKLRSEEQAILVGTNTALMDNPQLTNRLWQGGSPLRVVLDRSLKIPSSAQLLDGNTPTLLFTEQTPPEESEADYEVFNSTRRTPNQICDALYRRGVQSLIVEGGSKTLQMFIDSGLWDEAQVYQGSVTFEKGVAAPLLEELPEQVTDIAGDTLTVYKNRTS
ncbi:MAG: bifunctional diaminohydroxyphosphoribosylaminopyrimidine deaminase/5-amino-6-(5-phosphoribosylamino)uracil reductase RibD [Bacteroidota bacterium]